MANNRMIHRIIFQNSEIIIVVIGEKYLTEMSKNVTNQAHINIAQRAYSNEFLHCVNFIERISDHLNERKNIQHIMIEKKKYCCKIMISQSTRVATNIVMSG